MKKKRISFSSKQNQFIREANEVWNFKIGAVRSGKSYEDIAYEVVNGIVERSGLSGLNVIMGVSKSTIERNVLQPMREIYTSAIVGTINSQNICYIAGEPVYCIGAEKQSQVAKIQGSSIKFCYGDEVAKWHYDVFSMLESRLDKPYSRFVGSANPEHPNHWLKQFIDRTDIPIYVQHYTIDDNPFLPKEYVERLKQEYSSSQVLYRRLILGEWCLSDSRCYEALGDRPQDFMLKKLPDDFVITRAVGGCDFGGNKSANTFCMAFFDKKLQRVVFVKSERMEAKNTNADDLCDRFEEFIHKVREKYNYTKGIEFYCDSAEQTLINSMRKRVLVHNLGVFIYNALKRPINDRIKHITRMIGQNRIFWLEEARTSFDAMSSCVYNQKAGHEDERLDDLTTDIDSVDCTEYIIEPYFNELITIMELYTRTPINKAMGGLRA